jgi:hypothetical protein
MKMKNLNKDHSIAILFALLTLLFIVMFMTNRTFFDWAFDRHHNQLSWYIRPIFLIPFCFFAYKHSWSGVSITIFALFTSMFWFSKPEIVSENIIEFLQFEKEYLYGEWNTMKTIMALTIPISFLALGLSFWKRSLLMGLGVVILMSTGKIIWSIQNAGASGKSILIPAVIGVLICCTLIYFGFKKMEKKSYKK